jgi:hypothetical protein
VSQLARQNPYRSKASRAYWEQVGVNRHAAGRKGEIQRW